MSKQIYISVKFHPLRVFGFRIWLAGILVSLAAKIANGPIGTVEISD
jgi:hypothetical protein